MPLLWLQPLSYRVFAHFWIGLIADLDGQLLTPRRRPGVQKGYRGNLPREKIRTMANKLDKVTCDRFSVRLSLFIFSFFKIQSWAEAKKEVTDGNGLVAGAHITEYVERKGKRSLPVPDLALILKITLGTAIDRFLQISRALARCCTFFTTTVFSTKWL